MASLCPGVSRASGSGAFYYDDECVKMIDVPLGKCQGSYPLEPSQLKKYFGVESGHMGQLPEYLIAPHLDSTWNNGKSGSTGRSWWDITGEVVAYRPIEWVPRVKKLNTYPVSQIHTLFTKTTTTVTTSELFGSAEASFAVSGGAGWKGMKVEASATTKVSASYQTKSEVKEEIEHKAEFGEIGIHEIVLCMSLKVERVYERPVKLFQNDEKKGDSLTWDGPESWDDLWMGASTLRDVGSLQFHPIVMTGTGHSDSLWVQALPVVDTTTKKLTDMHLVLSNAGWIDWFVYAGQGGSETRRVETLPMPDNQAPVVTFIPFDTDSKVSE